MSPTPLDIHDLELLNISSEDLMYIFTTCSKIHNQVMDAVDLRKEYVTLAFFMLGLLLEMIGGCSFLVIFNFNDHGDLTMEVQKRLITSGCLCLILGLLLIISSICLQNKKVKKALETAQQQVDDYLQEKNFLDGTHFVVTHERVEILRRHDNIDVVIEPAIKVFLDDTAPTYYKHLSVLEKV